MPAEGCRVRDFHTSSTRVGQCGASQIRVRRYRRRISALFRCVLQRFCSVLQRVAVQWISDSRPSILATDFSTVVNCVAVCVVVYVAVCCSVLLQCSGSQICVFRYWRRISTLLHCVLKRVLQRIAACCSVLDLRFALFISATTFSTDAACVAACVTACCRALQCERSQIRVVWYRRRISALLRCVLQCVLQRVAACCNVIDVRSRPSTLAMDFSTVGRKFSKVSY